MPLEKLHARELKKSLDTVRALIQRREDGVEMLQALRGMFFHHRLFLIHQSLFSMPKYSVLIENKALQVSVNNVALVSPVSFSQTSSNAWSAVSLTINLHAGQNKICLVSTASGGPALDYLDVGPIRLAVSEQNTPLLMNRNAAGKSEAPAATR